MPIKLWTGRVGWCARKEMAFMDSVQWPVRETIMEVHAACCIIVRIMLCCTASRMLQLSFKLLRQPICCPWCLCCQGRDVKCNRYFVIIKDFNLPLFYQQCTVCELPGDKSMLLLTMVLVYKNYYLYYCSHFLNLINVLCRCPCCSVSYKPVREHENKLYWLKYFPCF